VIILPLLPLFMLPVLFAVVPYVFVYMYLRGLVRVCVCVRGGGLRG
jgi:hypothetical protein